MQSIIGTTSDTPSENDGSSLLKSLPFPSAAYSYNFYQQALDYWVDACQRQVLFVDVLRQRSNAHLEHEHDTDTSVLHFKYEMLLDGKKLAHPVNYQLMKIIPPEGVVVDPNKRPFIVFDPRAGHGPGIGGMKQDSEMGSTLRAGHPCYFVGFLPNPIEGQTVEHIVEAEAIFVAKVMALHPGAEKPCLIGNCQAGWQIAMLGSIYPELVGVLILAGAPLSYWAGVHGKNPMRYKGGLLGGSWCAALSSDLGNGRFDGAALVQGFEDLNPANTHWKKAYNLYSKVDTEAQRFLEFERWWGSPILLNKEEIQFIVDALFIGNRFSTANISTSDGLRIDIRNIKTPIVVFCSHKDDITPPQQALDWVLDLYRTEDEIVAAGQTIIYCLHQTIGHLGIFVASSVATKEHDKFIQNIDLIETLPPGLYEAVFTEKTVDTAHPELASGKHTLRFERRKLDDIRALGCNSNDDDRRFATLARVSTNIRECYDTFVSPIITTFVTEKSAEMLRDMQPIRVRYKMFSDHNPVLAHFGKMAEQIKQNRKPVPADNIFWQLQEIASGHIVNVLNAYRDVRDAMMEKTFMTIYGSPVLQASVGMHTSPLYSKSRAERDVDRERSIQKRIQSLVELAKVGSLPEAIVRALFYVLRGGSGIDERQFNVLRQLVNSSKLIPPMSLAEFKALVRVQHEMLVLDEAGAMEAISLLLDEAAPEAIAEALSVIKSVIEAHGAVSPEEARRLNKLDKYFVAAHTSLHRRASDIQVFGDR